jgi:hypothetical protein
MLDRIFSRKVGIISFVALLLIFLGCMSFSVGGRVYQSTAPEGRADGDLYIQEGDARLHCGEERDVYYPIPFLHPPNLELESDFDRCEILEQKEDHFRARLRGGLPRFADVHWKARGLRVPPGLPPPTLGPASPPPAGPVPPGQPGPTP